MYPYYLAEDHGLRPHQIVRYFDDAGNEIQLNEGKTYIAVAQKERKVVYS